MTYHHGWLGCLQLSTLVPHGAQLGVRPLVEGPRGALLATPGLCRRPVCGDTWLPCVAPLAAWRSHRAASNPTALWWWPVQPADRRSGSAAHRGCRESLLLASGPASLTPLRRTRAPLGHALMRIAGHQLLRDQQGSTATSAVPPSWFETGGVLMSPDSVLSRLSGVAEHFAFMRPTLSLLNQQTISARMLPLLNLAGFGMATWDPPATNLPPFRYRTTQVALFDPQPKLWLASCMFQPLAHIRGVPYNSTVKSVIQNVHPSDLDLVHWPPWPYNGSDLAGFRAIRFALADEFEARHCPPIQGSTDTVNGSMFIYISALGRSLSDQHAAAILAAVRSGVATVRHASAWSTASLQQQCQSLIFADGDNLIFGSTLLDFGRF